MNNLYIALSTHHLKYCEKIAEENKNGNNVVITSDYFEVHTERFDKVVFLKNTAYNQSDSITSKIKNIVNKTSAYKKAIKEIEYLRDTNRLNLFYSSLEDILSNYLFFSFSNNVQGIIIEDGVLNYYQHSLKDVSNFNFFLKKVIAQTYGLQLKSYNGHTTGIDYKKAKYQLVREPKYAIKPEKSRILPIEKRNLSCLNDNILIVGQEPYGSAFGKNVYMSKLIKLAQLIKNDTEFNSEKTIFYKPHRHGPRIDIKAIEHVFSNNVFEYIDEDISMEDLFFDKIKCKNIYTFDSSAVFSIFSDSPSVIQNKLNINVMPFHKSVLNMLFSKLNFTILPNDI